MELGLELDLLCYIIMSLIEQIVINPIEVVGDSTLWNRKILWINELWPVCMKTFWFIKVHWDYNMFHMTPCKDMLLGSLVQKIKYFGWYYLTLSSILTVIWSLGIYIFTKIINSRCLLKVINKINFYGLVYYLYPTSLSLIICI